MNVAFSQNNDDNQADAFFVWFASEKSLSQESVVISIQHY